MTERPLTPKQQEFVRQYVGPANGNATQAARLAGYKGNDKTLCEQGRQNLEHPGVIQALSRFRQELSRLNAAEDRKALLTAARSHEILTQIAEGKELETTVTVNKLGEFVENVAPPKLRDRLKALEIAGRQLGWDAPVKTEVSGTVGIALDPESDTALAMWLRYSKDPVIAARLAELEAE